MKTIENKKLYEAPEIVQVPFDNEISLVLESPPANPWGGDSHYEPNNTFKLPIA